MTTDAQSTAKKRIVIVDDHPMLRTGLAKLINDDPALSVAGEAATGLEALQLVAAEVPDLVVADLSLPDKDGLTMLKELLECVPSLPVLVLSIHDERTYAERVLRIGGRGYIMKIASGQQIKEALFHVLAGEIYLSPAMHQTMLNRLSAAPKHDGTFGVNCLTDRELQIYRQIGQGFKSNEIAGQLSISAKTVEAHCANIRAKLALDNASALRRSAIEWSQANKTGR